MTLNASPAVRKASSASLIMIALPVPADRDG
jgi:hypothetical protein